MKRAFVAGSNGPPSWEPLEFARKDAEDVARCLSGPRCTFDVVTPKQGADVLDLRGQLYGVADACAEGDTFICYFSGHGILEQGSLFLLWDETDITRLLGTALPASALTEAMRYCRANNKLLILDCCHAGAAIGHGFRNVDNVRAQDVVLSENHLVLMASDRLQRARELQGLSGGFMSQELCAALSGSFAEAAGADRRLSIGDAKAWLEQRANDHNRSDPEHAVPIPYLFGQQRGEFFFTTAADEWTPAIRTLAGTEFVFVPRQWAGPKGDLWVLALSRYPVLNHEYRDYVSQSGASEPQGEAYIDGRWVPDFFPWRSELFQDPMQPVVCLALPEAWEYAQWFADRARREESDVELELARHQFRIPASTEWDFAAFGSEHPSRDPLNWLRRSRLVHDTADAPAVIDKSGERDNPFGLSDMIGNVWEWTDNAQPAEWTAASWNARPTLVAQSLHDVALDGIGAENAPTALRGGGFLDDLRRTEPFVKEWELVHRRHTRHSDVGIRLGLRLASNDLPTDLRDRMDACEIREFDSSDIVMPYTA